MALRDLRGAVHGISDLSLETMQVFGSVVNETCDSVDVIIRAMYTAKKDMKRLVDTLEKLFVENTPA
ncbi:hypothetical protein M3Y99_01506400 [Aphelenchoides fujianensis]|nr:hypothetical protein M3Y99_01506400 [Aphelenchoides fujianensis]